MFENFIEFALRLWLVIDLHLVDVLELLSTIRDCKHLSQQRLKIFLAHTQLASGAAKCF